MSYQVALFGAGRIGNVHARNVVNHPSTTLVYVVDPVDASARSLAERFGALCVDEAAVFADPDIAAIVVCSLTSTHAELIEKGIAAGKAVFCEKPIDLDIRRVRQVLDAIEGSDTPLFVAFNRRFDAGVAEAKIRSASGDLGAIEKPKFFFTDRYAESYAAEWAHFVRVLDGSAVANPTGIDGYRALLLAEAAYLSLAEGRRVTVAETEARVLGGAA